MSSEDETRPNKPLPESKPTIPLPAVTDRALLEDLRKTVDAGFKTLSAHIDTLIVDSHGLGQRIGVVENRIAKLESPTIPPPRGLTSERARALIEAHPSKMDLETAAKAAEAIVKQQDLEKKIAETHALASSAATKADVEAVKMEFVVATNEQTVAILSRLDAVAKNPLVRTIAAAIGGAILTALATCSHPPLAQAPAPRVLVPAPAVTP